MDRALVVRKYGYVLLASAAILLATVALVVMQYRSARRAEGLAQQALEANLDLQLLGIVDEAKRTMLDHSNHIFHSIVQRRVRDRDMQGLEGAFTRASRRFPEVDDLYVVFIAPDSGQMTVYGFEEAERKDREKRSGRLIELGPDNVVLDAWKTIGDTGGAETHSLTAYTVDGVQFFFHVVYESDRIDREDDLQAVGLLAFTADVHRYPSADFLSQTIKSSEGERAGLLGVTSYFAAVDTPQGLSPLVGEVSSSAHVRRFDAADRLYPGLVFGLSAPDVAAAYADDVTQYSIVLGFAAGLLSLIGLFLTWRALRREMHVAQLKSDFLASISHELKTPLTAIRALGDLLSSGRMKDPSRAREYGGIIKAESDRLTTLINDILETSRMERGLRPYRLAMGSLDTVVVDAVEVFRHTEAAETDIRVEAEAGVTAEFDENAVKQAVLNLLSNAVKHASDGNHMPRVDVAVKADNGHAVVEVRDFGEGIPESEQQRIFEPFYRSPNGADGTGLGLAIVREVATAHGGEVSVESKPGAGALFRLTLPRS